MSMSAWNTLIVGWPGLLLAQAPPASPAPPDAMSIHSVWDFVLKGGWTMGAIGLCSLVALTLIVERAILLRRRAIAHPRFLAALKAVSSDRGRALQLCQSDGSPAAGVLGAAIRYREQGSERMERAVREAGTRVLVRLRNRMRLLSALPQVSTMLGLLGTIFGMIKTFQAVAASGQSLGKAELLAKGIFEAWTNTAAGLLVAIPVLVAYHMLMGRVDSAAVELDRLAVEWIENDGAFSPATATSTTPQPSVVQNPSIAASVVLAGA